MLKEALFYRKRGKSAQCFLCHHHCRLQEEEVGICGVRKFSQNRLLSLNYGQIAALAKDPIEKKPLYHFYPKTFAYSLAASGCNFKCKFCQNWHISQVNLAEIKEGKVNLGPEIAVEEALRYNCTSIAYTYSEPTVFIEYVLTVAQKAREKGLKNAFITNGFMEKAPLRVLLRYMDAFNVDLKAFSSEFYEKICAAGQDSLSKVLDNIATIKKAGKWLEITTLFIPSLNDSYDDMRQMAEFIFKLDKSIPWHISAFHPAYKLKDMPSTPLATLKKAYDIGKEIGLEFIYLGNIYSSGGENTYCPSCQRLLIEREGFSVCHNYLGKSAHCPYCGYKISGVFA